MMCKGCCVHLPGRVRYPGGDSFALGDAGFGTVRRDGEDDLVEATLSRDGRVAAVQPVDYKVGAPREGADGLELWDANKMQLGLQCLALRDNGYACDTGIIYYRVPLEPTPELEARVSAKGPIPPPLVDSPTLRAGARATRGARGGSVRRRRFQQVFP